MSQCIAPNWNQRHQRQEEQVEGEERNRSPHVQSHQNLSYVVPMCNNEVTELTWENGQLSLHGLVGGDSTLESIVHQATSSFNNNNFPTSSAAAKWDQNPTPINRGDGNLISCSMDGKWMENSSQLMQIERNDEITATTNSSFPSAPGETWRENSSHAAHDLVKKRGRSSSCCESDHQRKISSSNFQVDESACGSASAAFCRDAADPTMMTWPSSFESPRSLKSARITDDDSLYHDCSENQDGEPIIKGESSRSQSSARRSRAAAIHNLSERRRRDRINQKMKTLQKLVPNASKTDKASMLDEVIEYLKHLQAQVHMMSNARNMPQMVMPLGMQQLQMSLLARMGMGMGMSIGMGMIDVNNLARNVPHSFPPLIHGATPLGGTTPPFVSPPFTMPPVVPPSTPLKTNVDATTVSTSVPNFNDAFNTFLVQQSMNMDFLNKMSALYRQQGGQQPSKTVSLSLPNDGQAGE